MKLKRLTIGIILLFVNFQTGFSQKNIFTVFQLNIWQEGTVVPNGYEAIISEIIHKNADVVLLSEVRNINSIDFIKKLVNDLKQKGLEYHAISNDLSLDVATLSKFPIIQQKQLYQEENKMGNVLKTHVNIHNHTVIFYSIHLDYKHYACYLPRGYDGFTWKKLPEPITDLNEILSFNRKSRRDEAITDIINDAKNDEDSASIIISGDFNEPSHLDWNFKTKNLFDHRGTIVPWDCSTMLYANGYFDAYRVKFPNPVTHPGFTYPSFNEAVTIDKLAWAPEADDRDRIDYIYYKTSNKKIKLKNIIIVGPESTVKYAKKQEKDSKDKFLLPKATWPSDHKGLLATFEVK